MTNKLTKNTATLSVHFSAELFSFYSLLNEVKSDLTLLAPKDTIPLRGVLCTTLPIPSTMGNLVLRRVGKGHSSQNPQEIPHALIALGTLCINETNGIRQGKY